MLSVNGPNESLNVDANTNANHYTYCELTLKPTSVRRFSHLSDDIRLNWGRIASRPHPDIRRKGPSSPAN